MKTKMCGKCKAEKPISEYFKHHLHGLQNRCKACKRADDRIRNKMPTRRKSNQKHYERLKKEGYFKEYHQRPDVKKRKARQMREYNKNPILAVKRAARRMLRTHKNNGNIKQQPCLKCGETKTEGHHPDYSKPLLVIWLCPDCHRQLHAKAEPKKKLPKFKDIIGLYAD